MEAMMNKMESDEGINSEVALQCAKAAIILSALRHRSPNSTVDDGEEVWKLKKELAKEKLKNKKMRMCSLAEFILQIIILLCLWTLCLFIVFDFL